MGKLNYRVIYDAFFPELSEKSKENSKFKFNFNLFLSFLLLGLSCLTIFIFGIEKDKGFDKIVFILGISFLIYSILPLLFRKFFLFLLTIAILIYFLKFKAGCGVFAVVLFFTALSYFRNSVLRNLLALLFAIALSIVYIKVENNLLISTIIYYSSICLMIRYVYFLYEVNYFKSNISFVDRLNYFFMLPNFCFPLFPPVNPKTYFESYYSINANEQLKNSLTWIMRGIVHTLLYRIIYLHFSPSAYEVNSFSSLLLFILAGYSFMLRMSGIFYIALGFVQLFGYKLPIIFDHYFFTTGFSDFWRRINIYWGSFIARVFYYPIISMFKKKNIPIVILATTFLMFLLSWVLHNWQWFWIKGNFHFIWNDLVFWTFLGFVISIHQFFRIRKKSNPLADGSSYKSAIIHGTKIYSMLLLMSLLWCMWTTDSISEFIYILSLAKLALSIEIIIFILLSVFIIFIFSFIYYLNCKHNYFQFIFKDSSQFISIIICTALIVSSSYARHEKINSILSIVEMRMNQRDKSIMERGYYENILNSEKQQIVLASITGITKQKWNLDANACLTVNNELLKEFKPNFITSFKGDSLTTNSFGLRDKQYSLLKPLGSFRVALLGGSYEMGSGVGNEENYPALLEKYLNENSKSPIEILNFAVGGYHLPQQLYLLNHKVFQFKPDLIIYVAHTREIDRALENVVNLCEKNVSITDRGLAKYIKIAGIENEMCRLEKYNRLKFFANKMVYYLYSKISSLTIQNDTKLEVFYLPASVELRYDSDKKKILNMLNELGVNVFDLSGVYDNHQSKEIQLSEWDTHPNKLGHELIAKKIVKLISKKKNTFDFKNQKQ